MQPGRLGRDLLVDRSRRGTAKFDLNRYLGQGSQPCERLGSVHEIVVLEQPDNTRSSAAV